jgi:hypothetical protein
VEVIQQVFSKFLLFGERILDVLEGKTTYVEFECELQKELKHLGAEIMRAVLEGMDETLREDKTLRPGWRVVHKGSKRNVKSLFGNVEYKRRYFEHEETKTKEYLVDRVIGLGKHEQVDLALRAQAVEQVTELSYAKSASVLEENIGECIFSRQTVMNLLRKTAVPVKKGNSGQKKALRVLYVEADEDHVVLQNGKRALCKLVYVHEGIDTSSKRHRLKNPHYISGIYEGSSREQIWWEAWEYIQSQYDEDKLERIYLSGDGASWIREGLEFLPNAVFVLDKYHLQKYVNSATIGNEHLRKNIWIGIRNLDYEAIKKVLAEAGECAQTDAQKKAAQDCRRYIRRNWDGIASYSRHASEICGCSAEGHVSHILSARLTSRPCSWSKVGLDKMAKLRAAKANGIVLRDEICNESAVLLEPMIISSSKLKKQHKTIEALTLGHLDNMPILDGCSSQLRKVLKSIAFPA